MSMIEVSHISHDYEGKGKFAVKDISFNIEKGEIFGFLGPSGAGKSTVQHLMIRLLQLQEGDIRYNSTSIKDIDTSFFNQLGVSFELPNAYSKLTGYENLKYFRGMFSGETEDPMKLLEMVGLAEDAHKRAANYSRGMLQRLIFARALINRPEIIFLDEPTSGLDPNTAAKIKAIIRDKAAAGATIFLTTHNMFTADELCDRVAFINEGQVVAIDEPRNLKLQYGDRSIQVEYMENGTEKTDLFFLENEADNAKMQKILQTQDVQTMHTQEATLEQIFMKLTGRGLE